MHRLSSTETMLLPLSSTNITVGFRGQTGLTKHMNSDNVREPARDLHFADTLLLLLLPLKFPKSLPKQASVETDNYFLCASQNSVTHKTIHHRSRLLELIDHSNCLGEKLLLSIH